MKQLVIIWIILWLVPCTLVAGIVDSVDYYITTGRKQVLKGDFNQALAYYAKAESYGKRTGNYEGQVIGLQRMGRMFKLKGMFDSAFYHVDQAILLSHKHLGDQHVLTARSYNEKGYLTLTQETGTFQEADSLFDLALGALGEGLSGSDSVRASIYESRGVSAYLQGDYQKALDLVEQALEIRQAFFGKTHVRFGDSYNMLGVIWNYLGDFDQSLTCYQKALEVYRLHMGDTVWTTLGVMNHIGSLMLERGEYEEALWYYQETLKPGVEEKLPPRDKGIYRYNIALVYNNMGNYDEALRYLDLSNDILTEAFGPDHQYLPIIYHEKSRTYSYLKELEEAEKMLQQSIELYTAQLGAEHPDMGTSYDMMGILLTQQDKFREALPHFQKSLEIRLAYYGDTHSIVGDSYTYLGNCYLQLGEYDQSEEILNKTLNIYQKTLRSAHPDLLWTYYKLGEVHVAKGQYQTGMDFYHQAFQALDSTYVLENDYSLPDLTGKLYTGYLMELITSKGNSLFEKYEDLKNATDLQGAFDTYLLAVALSDSLRSQYRDAKAKQTLIDETMPAYEGAIKCAVQLFELRGDSSFLHQAFTISEKGKSLILLETLNEATAIQYAGIPDNLLAKEQKLRKDQKFYEEKLQQELLDPSDVDSSRMVLWRKRIANLNQQYNDLLRVLEKEYPRYFDLKYDMTVASAAEVQAFLRSGQAMVSYFEGSKSRFIFYLDKKEVRVVEQSVDTSFANRLTTWRKSLAEPGNGFDLDTTSMKQFINESYALYETLIPAIPKHIQQVVIIPDGMLGYIPFEVLITNPPSPEIKDYRSLDYLFKHWLISYAYSASLWTRQSPQTSQADIAYLGFAPSYPAGKNETAADERSSLKPLTHTAIEIREGVSLFSGDVYEGTLATKFRFQQEAAHSSILHLAMHAKADDVYPLRSRMYFSNQEEKDPASSAILFAFEIYNMHLNAQLAILSACETGIGKLQRGEGIMSLGRAFAYAGCPSVMTTLWRTDDLAGKEIVTAFLQALHAGKNKAQALHDARLQYLEKTDPLRAHPYYWAGFVQMGNDLPLEKEVHVPFWMIILGIGIGIGLIGIIYLLLRIRPTG